MRIRFSELVQQAQTQLWTQQLVAHLEQFLHDRRGEWCLYQALDSEISLAQLPLRTSHLRWIYPRVKDGKLRFFEPRSGFEKAYAGILEPVIANSREVSIQEISGFLIPGLGFDEKGVRLGKGKGFYDEALKDFSGEKVGISFSPLIVQELPEDPWDVKMQWLATEKGVLKV